MKHILLKSTSVKGHMRNIKGRAVYIRQFTREGKKAGDEPRRFLIGGGRRARVKIGETYEYKTEKMNQPAKLKVVGKTKDYVEVMFPYQDKLKNPKPIKIHKSKFLGALTPAARDKATKPRQRPQYRAVRDEAKQLEKWKGLMMKYSKQAAIAYGIPITIENGNPSDSFADLMASVQEEFIHTYRRETARKEKRGYDPLQAVFHALKNRAMRFAAQQAKTVNIPRRVILRLTHIAKEEKALANELGRYPNDHELFERIKIVEGNKPEGERWKWNAPGDVAKPIASIEDFKVVREELQMRVTADPNFLDQLKVDRPNIPGPEEGSKQSMMKQKIIKVLDSVLGRKEREVFYRVHYLGYETDEVERDMGLKEGRGEAIRQRAMNKIRRNKWAKGQLKNYLKKAFGGEETLHPLLGFLL